jgi:hypothetical protein
MNIKELIKEFYNWRPLPPPEETGLLEPLKLEDLPRAIQMLKAYELVKAPYETVPLVRARVGEFITDYLVKNGLEGAEQIASVFKAARRKGPRNEYDELAHIGRVLYAWLRFSKQRTDAGKLPTKGLSHSRIVS